MDLQDLTHPTFKTAVGTFVSYGAILVVMFVLLFVVPYAVFQFL